MKVARLFVFETYSFAIVVFLFLSFYVVDALISYMLSHCYIPATTLFFYDLFIHTIIARAAETLTRKNSEQLSLPRLLSCL